MSSRCTVLCARLAWLVLCLPASTAGLQAQPLHFAAERVVVTAAGQQCSVTGEYHMRNPGPAPVQVALVYPFPVSADQPLPDSVLVEDVLGRTPITHTVMDSAILFPVRIPPSSTRIYRVSYRQRTPRMRFEYILTTTRRWPLPVGDARFTIVIPDDLRLRSCVPQPDSVTVGSGRRVYHIERRQFVSDQNLVVRWERSSR